jgi:hypothetical protein
MITRMQLCDNTFYCSHSCQGGTRNDRMKNGAVRHANLLKNINGLITFLVITDKFVKKSQGYWRCRRLELFFVPENWDKNKTLFEAGVKKNILLKFFLTVLRKNLRRISGPGLRGIAICTQKHYSKCFSFYYSQHCRTLGFKKNANLLKTF